MTDRKVRRFKTCTTAWCSKRLFVKLHVCANFLHVRQQRWALQRLSQNATCRGIHFHKDLQTTRVSNSSIEISFFPRWSSPKCNHPPQLLFSLLHTHQTHSWVDGLLRILHQPTAKQTKPAKNCAGSWTAYFLVSIMVLCSSQLVRDYSVPAFFHLPHTLMNITANAETLSSFSQLLAGKIGVGRRSIGWHSIYSRPWHLWEVAAQKYTRQISSLLKLRLTCQGARWLRPSPFIINIITQTFTFVPKHAQRSLRCTHVKSIDYTHSLTYRLHSVLSTHIHSVGTAYLRARARRHLHQLSSQFLTAEVATVGLELAGLCSLCELSCSARKVGHQEKSDLPGHLHCATFADTIIEAKRLQEKWSQEARQWCPRSSARAPRLPRRALRCPRRRCAASPRHPSWARLRGPSRCPAPSATPQQPWWCLSSWTNLSTARHPRPLPTLRTTSARWSTIAGQK